MRLALPLALPLAAGACGFRPLYGGAPGDAVVAELAAIEVATPTTRLGQILKNQLVTDLDPAGLGVVSRYRLDVAIERTQKSLAIQLDERVTRFDLTLAAFFALTALDGGAAPPATAERPALYRSAVRRVASYNVVREPFATLIAEQDAERRAAVDVSREIRTLLTLYFENERA